MRKSYIIGVGGFAKEVFFLLKTKRYVDQSFAGFIDKGESRKVMIGNEELDVINEDDFLNSPNASDSLIYVGIGNPKILQNIQRRYDGFEFPNLIHDSLEVLFTTLKIGKGNIITAGCIFTVDIELGSFNVVNLNTTIGHDTKIGDCNVLNPGVNVSGSVVIGSANLIGTNATILQEVRIGSGNTIGAATLVNKRVEDDSIIVGVPGKPLIRK
ncbi:MAG: acetyltransferase [Bacteroidota bacterium]